jgi:hypothetical protein
MSKATLIDIRVQQADNNIRRNTASFAINYPAADETAFAASYTIAPTDSKLVEPVSETPAVILVRTSAALSALITFSDNSTKTITVNKALLLDAGYKSIEFTNSGTESVNLFVHQG